MWHSHTFKSWCTIVATPCIQRSLFPIIPHIVRRTIPRVVYTTARRGTACASSRNVWQPRCLAWNRFPFCPTPRMGSKWHLRETSLGGAVASIQCARAQREKASLWPPRREAFCGKLPLALIIRWPATTEAARTRTEWEERQVSRKTEAPGSSQDRSGLAEDRVCPD